MNRSYYQRFVAMLLCLPLWATIAHAGDFIDDINAATRKYGYGHRVIYEMNIGSFTTEGTLTAATARLGELKSTGIDVIWLMPIFPRGADANSIGSPYAVRVYQDVNTNYTANKQDSDAGKATRADELKAFVDAAHALNMEVWLDWVANHTATDHNWVAREGFNYYLKQNGTYVHPNGYNDVYQLDFSKTAMKNDMVGCMEYWIDKAGIDGFRCDYVSSPYIPTDFWTNTIKTLKNYKSGKTITMLGEADFTDATRLYDCGWDYDYAWWFNDRLQEIGSSSNAASLKNYCQQLVNNGNYGQLDRMVYLTNHDVNGNYSKTLASMYGDNRYLMSVLQFTLYGMPLLYNGQEIGGSDVLNYFSDSKVNWNNRDNKMYNTVRTLTALKHNIEAFQDDKTTAERGTVNWISTNNSSVLAYIRRHGSSEALVVLNLGTGSTSVSLSGITAGTYTQWLDSKTIADGVSQSEVSLGSTANLSLDAHGYAVYVLKDGASGEGSLPDGDSNSQITLYVKSNHDNFNIWAWNADGNSLNSGSWPGTIMSAVNDEGWHYASFNSSNVSFKLSENGSNESGECYGVTTDSYFYYLGAALISADDMSCASGERVAYFARTGNDEDWSQAACYAWSGNGDAGLGNWPGTACTQAGTAHFYVNGTAVERTLWKIDLSGVAEGANLIFNNNNNGQQQADVTCQYGSFYNGGNIYAIPATSQQSSPVNIINIYVKSDHSDINIWAWNDNGQALYDGNWPGASVTQTDESGWKYISYAADMVNFKFNSNGSDESGECYGVTADSYFYYLGAALIKAADMSCTSGERVAYFARTGNDDDWNQAACYAWSGNGDAGLGNWPGRICTKAGIAYYFVNGQQVERTLWKIDLSGVAEGANLIFNNNNNGQQQPDVTCRYGAYYASKTYGIPTATDTQVKILDDDVTAIGQAVSHTISDNAWYTMNGQRTLPSRKGIYIRQGRKVVVR